MMKLKIGEKEFSIKFAYVPTLKSRIVSRIVGMEEKVNNTPNSMELVEDLLMLLPEIILVGLQKYHKDEYGYDYMTGDGWEEQLEKTFELIEEYADSDDSDIMELFRKLEEEMMNESFLSKMFAQEKAKAKKTAKEAFKKEQS